MLKGEPQEGCSECAAVHAEQGRLTQIYYPSHEGAQTCCIFNRSLKKCNKKKIYIYIGGNAKFAGWDSHLIKHTRKE